MSPRLLSPLLVLATLLAATACSGGIATTGNAEEETGTDVPASISEPSIVEETAWDSDAAANPSLVAELGIVFPSQDTPPRDTPLLQETGVLFVDERGCLRLRDSYDDTASPVMPVWPNGYDLVAEEGGEALILDEEAGIVARVGEEVQLVGFGIEGPLPSDNSYLDDRHARELAELCPGPYWILGNVISSPPPPPGRDK